MSTMAAPMEIELKLKIDPANAAMVSQLPVMLAGCVADAPAPRAQHDTYYDTADRALLRQGLALRVRARNGTWVQTVKAAMTADAAQSDAHVAGVAARSEWEWPLPDSTPDPGRLQEINYATLATTIAPTDLRAVYQTRVERQSWLVWPNACSAIEIAVDVGVVAGARGERAFAEVEFELKRGRAASLYDLALALLTAMPATPSLVSKAELGLEMAYGIQPGAVKAALPVLQTDTTTATAFRALMRASLGHLLTNMPVSLRGEDPEGVHQMRVALRRMRSVMALFKPVMRSSTLQTHIDELRWLGQALGAARDLDVLATQTLPALRAHAEAPDMTALAAAVAEARADSAAHIRTLLTQRRFSRTVLGLCLWVEGGGWNDALPAKKRPHLRRPLAEKATRWLEREHDKLHAFAATMDWQSLEHCHALRKKFKKLRYGLESTGALVDADALDIRLAEAKALQESFGLLNDAAVAAATLAPLAKSNPDTASAITWICAELDARAETSRAALQQRWQAFAATAITTQTLQNDRS
jgi:triphosphatase